jgi:phosphotriesterase-related protein
VSRTPTGKVQTVSGVIDADQLGITLPHEHLLLSQRDSRFVEPLEASARARAHESFRVENRWRFMTNANANLDNIVLDDVEMIIEEAGWFTRMGGRTIVDCGSIGIGRDPDGLRAIAGGTGLNVVMGSGYYIDKTHPIHIREADERAIADEIVSDICVGVGYSRVKAGIIGEIGCEGPTDQELKVLRAAVLAQKETGAVINIHTAFIFTGRDGGLRVAEELDRVGADCSRVIYSHQDGSGADPEYQRQLLERGIVLEYDCFGVESTTFAYGGVNWPKDKERIEDIQRLINDGWISQLLISQDTCFKMQMKRFGGVGYSHILDFVVPLMRHMGMNDDQIEILMSANPKRLFPFAPTNQND